MKKTKTKLKYRLEIICSPFLLSLFLLNVSTYASEGFKPSRNKNVFYIKGSTSGATAFLLRLPSQRLVLVSQVHVLRAVGEKPTLYWDMKSGPLFRVWRRGEDFLKVSFQPEIIWHSVEKDIVVLRVPERLIEKSEALGLNLSESSNGTFSLVGYPIVGRRTFPRTSKFATRLGEFLGTVTQMTSTGRIWDENNRIWGDIDAISGNSGGPVLDSAGNVFGVIYKLTSWYGIGYKYLNPNLEITPIAPLISEIEKAVTHRELTRTLGSLCDCAKALQSDDSS